jgi:sulfur carrier protein
MQVRINQLLHQLPDGSSLAQALEAGGFHPPYAVAVNLHFIPKTQYATTALKENDEIEVISPITGG